MTPAQQQREIKRQAREIAAAQKAPPNASARRRRRPQRDAARARQRSIDTAIRTGGRVVTSRLGQDIVRGIFGTLFGGGKSR